MSKIVIIDPRTDPRWDELISSHPRSTIFHTSVWAKIIAETYDYKPVYLMIEDDDHRVAGGVPMFLITSPFTGRRLVSLPFTDLCEPLVEPLHQDAVRLRLMELVHEYRVSYLELRSGQHPIADPGLVTWAYYKNFIIELSPDFTRVENRVIKRVRRYIRNVCQPNLKVSFSSDRSDIKRFYDLITYTRRKHGVFPQPYAFFHAMNQALIEKGNGFMAFVSRGSKIVCGGLYLTHKQSIYHKFTGSDDRFSQYRPNHFMVWQVLRHACENGYIQYDFGRTSPDNRGLMSFKGNWGAREEDLPYYYWPRIQGAVSMAEKSLKYRVMSTIGMHMPIPVLKMIGSLFYRHLG